MYNLLNLYRLCNLEPLGEVRINETAREGMAMTAQPDAEATEDLGDAEQGDDRTYIGATDLRRQIRKVLELVRFKDRRFVVNKHGEPQAAVVPIEDLQFLEYLENKADRKRLEDLQAEDSETLGLEEFEGQISND